ncbi:MAG: hypothetical protein KY461_09540, partial [Actinobacteria bacterium]|nr:hypothetical protein [Actinomycetota bacterium]
MGWAEFHQLTATRRVLTWADVDACGIARSTFDDRSRTEGWPARPYPGVIVPPGPPLTPRQRIEAAVRSVTGEVWVGGHAALFLHGVIDRPPTQTLLWVPVSHRGATSRTRLVRRTSLLTAEDSLRIDGFPTVQAAWALRDVAGETSLERLRNLAVDARFKQVLGPPDLDWVVRKDRRFAGRRCLAQVAEDLRDDGSDSGFEFRVFEELAAVGLAPDRKQKRLWTPGRPRDVDIAYDRYRVGVDCDGLAYHGRDQQDADAERDNDIAAHGGWVILKLTWRMQFGTKWTAFVDQLEHVLTARGHPGRQV